MSKQVIRFTVPGVPIAQPRPRATLAHDGKHARLHEVTHIKDAAGKRKPHPIAQFKASVALAAANAYSGPPLEQPLRVDILFVFPRTRAQIWKTKPMPRLPHPKKPDRDNIDKAVLDALTGLLWIDDCQVFDGRLTKVIAAGHEQPHTIVIVTPYDPATDADLETQKAIARG